MIQMLNAQEALAELQRLENAGVELLGVDGLRLHPDGSVEAPIDLILDFTTDEAPSTTPAQRFAEARQFVIANGGPQIRWEIVSGSEQG